MLSFSGFNGFGQFGCEHGRRVKNFKRSSIDERLSNSSTLLVSCSWSYTAYAAGTNLLLKGFIGGQPYTELFVSTCDTIKQIATCDRFCLVLLENGKLFKIDPKSDAQFQEVSCESTYAPRKRNIFGDVKSPRSTKFTFIVAGSNITAAVDDSNTIYSIPSKIFQLPKHVRIRQLVCGFEHALLLNGNGDVYSWGNGLRGQLGTEPMQVEEAPVLIEALAGIKITYIAAGGWHSAAISAFGDLYTWGFNSNGQLGLRLFKPSGLKEPAVYPLPQLSDLPDCCICSQNVAIDNENCTPVKVFAGARHTVLQMNCGSLLATGGNKHGQLSLNEEDQVDQCDIFKKINLQKDFGNDFRIICGPWCTVVLSEQPK